MSNPYRNWPNCLLNGEVGRAYRFKVTARREHAHRVFAAIQAVVAVVAATEILYLERRGWRHDPYDASRMRFLANWPAARLGLGDDE
jgi:hypothetical protein